MPLLPQGQCPRPSAPSPTALAPGSPSAVSGGRWSSTGGSSRPQARWPQSCVLHGSPLRQPRFAPRPAVIPPPRRLRHCGVTRPPLPVQIRTAGGFSFEKVTRPRWSATGVGVGWPHLKAAVPGGGSRQVGIGHVQPRSGLEPRALEGRPPARPRAGSEVERGPATPSSCPPHRRGDRVTSVQGHSC